MSSRIHLGFKAIIFIVFLLLMAFAIPAYAADDSDSDVSIDGEQAYAILYSNGDFVFQRGADEDPSEGTVEGKWTGFETAEYSWYEKAPWSDKRALVKAVVVKDDISPVATACWFWNCTALESVSLDKLDMSSVTNMNWMFYGCESLQSIDVSGFDTSNVTTMARVFYNCKSLQSIDVSQFETSGVTDMNRLFFGCESLEALQLSSFNTSDVADMTLMFSGCSSLETLDITGWDTSSLVHVNKMFSGCSSLTGLDLSSLDITSVIPENETIGDGEGATLGDMFEGCSSLEVLRTGTLWSGDDSWDAYAPCFPKLMYDLSGTEHLAGSVIPKGAAVYTSLKPPCAILYADGTFVIQPSGMPDPERGEVLEKWGSVDTTDGSPWYSRRAEILAVVVEDGVAPTSTKEWFSGCSNLVSVDLSGLDTSSTQSMNSMFYGCESLQHLDLTEFDTSSVETMETMFEYCSSLESLDVSSFDTSGVSTMNGMFAHCPSLTSLDLSSFDTSGVTTMSGMFVSDHALASLDMSSFTTDASTNMSWMLHDCPALSSVRLGPGFTFSSSGAWLPAPPSDSTYTGKWVGGSTGQAYTPESLATSYDGATMAGLYRWQTQDDTPNAILYDDGTLVFQPNGTPDPERGEVLQKWGRADTATNAPWVSRANDILYVETVGNVAPTSMAGWFTDCSNLQSVDFSGLDTSRVNDMHNLFINCASLTSFDFSQLSTGCVKDMSNMFGGCESLSTISCSELDASSVERMYGMFYGCSALEALDLSDLNTEKLTTMHWMFNGCSSLRSIDLSNFCTSNVADMAYLFAGCNSLESLDLSSFDTSEATIMDGMFYDCPALSSISLGPGFFFSSSDAWLPTPPNSSAYTGKWISDLTKQTYTPESLATLYDGATMAGLYRWQTADETPSAILYGDGTLVIQPDGTPDPTRGEVVEKWGQVDEVAEVPWSSRCNEITAVEAIGNVSPVTMNGWFAGCSNLREVDLTGLDSSRVEDMSYLFSGCEALSSLDLSYFNTSGAKTMQGMFMGCSSLEVLDITGFNTGDVTTLEYMFYNCSSLKQVDLSCFRTSHVVSMDGMFYGCESMKSIDLSSFEADNLETAWGMFSNCMELESVDLSGFETRNLVNASQMFETCPMLVSIDLSSFDTSHVTNMSRMFCECARLKELNLSAFSTSNVENMNEMFSGCTSLTSLDLSAFNTQNVTSMSHMFYNCRRLQSLDLSSFNMGSVEGAQYMFYGCSSLRQVDCSGWNTSHMTSFHRMFENCTALESIVGMGQWDTRRVRDMNEMFNRCSNLQSLDFENWDTSLVSSMWLFTGGCDRIGEITIGQDFEFVGSGAGMPAPCPYTFGYDGRWHTDDGGSYLMEDIPFGVTNTYYASPFVPLKTDITWAGFGVDSQVYSGSPLELDLHFTFLGRTLTKGIDYSVEFENNINYGTAIAHVSGIGDYAGELDVSFNIDQFDIGILETPTSLSFVYSGNPIEPKPDILFAGESLVYGQDLSVSYTDNIDVGMAHATVCGEGNFTGELSFDFEISKAPALDNPLNVITFSGAYDGRSHSAVGTAAAGSTIFYKVGEADWTEAAPSWTDAGDYVVSIKAVNPNYEDSVATASVNISKRCVSLESGSASREYDGSVLACPDVAVGGDGFAPGEGASFTVTGSQKLVG
ncbi:MAG: BspA family leucine-rich repeat surface protein, partial [Coriobacteriales bacterium]